MNFFFQGAEFRQETVKLSQMKLYLWVFAFSVGNLLLPVLVHSVPQGGLIFLPIYFFTLIAAYRFGLLAGLAVALISPLTNHLLTGMPPLALLDVVVVKSVLLAVVAALVARRTERVSLVTLLGVLVAYQLFGGLYAFGRTGSLQAAMGDWILGWPGLVLQLVLGGAILMRWRGKNA